MFLLLCYRNASSLLFWNLLSVSEASCANVFFLFFQYTWVLVHLWEKGLLWIVHLPTSCVLPSQNLCYWHSLDPVSHTHQHTLTHHWIFLCRLLLLQNADRCQLPACRGVYRADWIQAVISHSTLSNSSAEVVPQTFWYVGFDFYIVSF